MCSDRPNIAKCHLGISKMMCNATSNWSRKIKKESSGIWRNCHLLHVCQHLYCLVLACLDICKTSAFFFVQVSNHFQPKFRTICTWDFLNSRRSKRKIRIDGSPVSRLQLDGKHRLLWCRPGNLAEDFPGADLEYPTGHTLGLLGHPRGLHNFWSWMSGCFEIQNLEMSGCCGVFSFLGPCVKVICWFSCPKQWTLAFFFEKSPECVVELPLPSPSVGLL